MARHPSIRPRWSLLRDSLTVSSPPDRLDYAVLSRQVVLVVSGFIALGLLFALVMDLLPRVL